MGELTTPDLSTRRLRLYHLTRLNAPRLDYDLAPLLAEIDALPVAERAAMRVLFTLAEKYLQVDLRQHPSALLLVLLHVTDDATFDRLWESYAPMLAWVARAEQES